MAYPEKYLPLLKALQEGPAISLAALSELFPGVRAEIEANRHRAKITRDDDPDDMGLQYEAARSIVMETVIHHGFLEIGDELHDSVDDCADLLMDLAAIEKLKWRLPVPDVWWAYSFGYDSHFGAHMRNIEAQARWLASRGAMR